ncbi:MAG: thioredoxin-like domain-containing protein [Spirochaeta sp.]
MNEITRRHMFVLCMLIMSVCGTAAVTADSEDPEISTDMQTFDGFGELLGPVLHTSQGETVDIDTLDGKTVGIYFSAEWCSYCRSFSPLLVEVYRDLQALGKPFEVVLVSGDRNEADMYEYMIDYHMPWLAVPYDSPQRNELPEAFGVRGIPTLIILGPDGEVLSRDGRVQIRQHGEDSYELWHE